MKRLHAVLLLATTACLTAQSALYNMTFSWVHSPSWDTNTTYVVKQSLSNGPFVPLASTTNNVITVSNVLGQQMRIHVVLTNLWGESIPSNELKFPPYPSAPSSLGATTTKQ